MWVVCHNGPKTSACTRCMQHYSDQDYTADYGKAQCTEHGRNGDSNAGSDHITSFSFSGNAKLGSDEVCGIAWTNCVYAE